MKIGIFVHSLTGNTLSVAEKLKAALFIAGHSVVLERITVKGGEDPHITKFSLENPPDTAPYDAVILGAPVRGFSVSPVIVAYIRQADLNGKKLVCFVTKHLANNWTGGNRALKSMEQLSREKGGDVLGHATVFWKSERRDAMTSELVKYICGLLN